MTILTDVVLPGETNYLDNLFGGELLARMDRACSIAARRHSRRIVVTASVNHVAFNKSVPVGSVVTIEAKVSRAFTSSMEIYVDVWIEDRQSGSKTKVNEGIYTFVAVDETGKPVEIPQIIPKTDLEKELTPLLRNVKSILSLRTCRYYRRAIASRRTKIAVHREKHTILCHPIRFAKALLADHRLGKKTRFCLCTEKTRFFLLSEKTRFFLCHLRAIRRGVQKQIQLFSNLLCAFLVLGLLPLDFLQRLEHLVG